MSTLIDTSAWVEALRRKGDGMVRAQVGALLESGDARLTEPVLLELWNGARGKAELNMLRDIADRVPMLTCNRAVYEDAFQVARRCRAAGLTVPSIDVLIFSVAAHHGVLLLEKDAHFDSIRAIVK